MIYFLTSHSYFLTSFLTVDAYLNKFQKFKAAWQSELSTRGFKIRFLITLILLGFVLFSLARFLSVNEHSPGFEFNDPLLNLYPAVNVTWLTFGLIYLGLIIAVGLLAFHPRELIIALQSYTLIASFRLITIFFLPLNAPSGIIPLKDPFIEFFGNGNTLLRDLFFSGHTATMFLFFLTSPSRKLKVIFLICTVLIAICVLAQHVHYSIDVIVAPFISYTCYRIICLINQEVKKN
jgi:hypothetical protein